MDCEQAAELIMARVDDECGEEDEITLDAHLAGCPDCRAQAAGFALQDAALWRAFAPGRALAEDLAGRIESKLLRDLRPRRAQRGFALFATAAAIVLAAAIVAWPQIRERTVIQSRPPLVVPLSMAKLTYATGEVFQCPSGDTSWRPLATGSTLALGCRVRTGDLSKCEIALDDGSLLRLNSGTEACFVQPGDVRLNKGQLSSHLPDRVGPLKINTDLACVTASGAGQITGTRLDLVCTADGSTLNVISGAAEVTGKDASTPIRGGQTMQIGGKTDAFKCVASVDRSQPMGWEDDLLALRPGDDPALIARVSELLEKVVLEQSSLSADGPGPVENAIRHRPAAWVTPLANIARAGGVGVSLQGRRTAARLLGDIAPASYVPELVDLLEDADYQVRVCAGVGLRRITAQQPPIAPADFGKMPDSATIAVWRAWSGTARPSIHR